MPNTTLQLSQIDPSFAGLMFRNRLHNGAMMIDQHNAGASQTPLNGAFILDRWAYSASQASKITAQQNQGSVTPPAGFASYLGVTSSSSYAVGAAEAFLIGQGIEGFTVADFNWGTANAKAASLSFWAYSSLTGTFGGVVKIYGGAYSFPFTYTISAANTWTYVTVQIAAPTAGAWPSGTNASVYVGFSLGAGASVSGPAGAWAAASYSSATGAVSVVGTSGATLYITGAQLEAGATSTAFENRTYPDEMRLCERYYQPFDVSAQALGIGSVIVPYYFRTLMRATPTVTNVIAGTLSSATVSTDSGSLTPRGGYFQIAATVASGYVIGRVNAASAEI